jgi:hypothetical protein
MLFVFVVVGSCLFCWWDKAWLGFCHEAHVEVGVVALHCYMSSCRVHAV